MRSRSVRGGCPRVRRACWIFLRIPGRGTLGCSMCVWADGGPRVLGRCPSVLGPTAIRTRPQKGRNRRMEEEGGGGGGGGGG
eukprot:7201868-Pyramimonas_sp.AAC.1